MSERVLELCERAVVQLEREDPPLAADGVGEVVGRGSRERRDSFAGGAGDAVFELLDPLRVLVQLSEEPAEVRVAVDQLVARADGEVHQRS